MGHRHRARELVLRFLYSLDLSKSPSQDVLERFSESWFFGEPEGEQEFAKAIINGVVEHLGEIDELLESYSINWKLSRMEAVDRNILRLAVFELKWTKDTPPKVVLNEAIELAKEYGTEESSAFVNGILDKIASEVNG